MLSFQRLDEWQQARRLVIASYRATQAFPREERFGITAQIRRAAVSVATNIAEGASKSGSREFRRYLSISLGSLGELSCLFQLSADLEYLTLADLEALEQLRSRVGKMTWRLRESLPS